MTGLKHLDHIAIAVGTALIGIGAGKITAHGLSSPFGVFDICGSSGGLAFSLGTTAHCWGCPVAVAGLALLLVPLLRGQAERHRRRTAAMAA